MRAPPILQALTILKAMAAASPLQRQSLRALGAGVGALALAAVAPAAGLLALAALMALSLVSATQAPVWRLDRLAVTGLVVCAAAAAAAGVPGFVGAVFCWFLADSARAALRRSAQAATAPNRAWGERLPIPLAAAFAAVLVASQAPHVVLGLPLDLPHPPPALILAVGLAYALSAADWLVRILARWRLGEARPGLIAADVSFHAVLMAGFALCPDVSAGVTGLIAYRLALAIPTPQPAPAAG